MITPPYIQMSHKICGCYTASTQADGERIGDEAETREEQRGQLVITQTIPGPSALHWSWATRC
jgi:hypothetical protein